MAKQQIPDNTLNTKKLTLIVPALSLEWHLMEHSMLEERVKS